MKLLKDILYKVRIEQVVGSTNTAIEKIAFDSRQVTAFTAFVATRGTQVDGHAFIAKAVEALEAGKVGRIVLSRPAVEAGESLGFLPGEMEDKLAPYLRPLYDALSDRLSMKRVRALMTEGAIEIAPGRQFVYELSRPGGRLFQVEFDLTRPVPPPPAPWGSKDPVD